MVFQNLPGRLREPAFAGCFLTVCDGLNENATPPQTILMFDAQLVWERVGYVVLLEEVCHLGGGL